MEVPTSQLKKIEELLQGEEGEVNLRLSMVKQLKFPPEFLIALRDVNQKTFAPSTSKEITLAFQITLANLERSNPIRSSIRSKSVANK